MTNEEKIKEILHSHKNDTKWFMLEEGASEYLALKEMAEWKDKEFEEYLVRKRQKIASILEDITEENARYFILYQRYIYLGVIIDELDFLKKTETDNSDREE